jgi:hypothetical protein
VLQAKEKEGAEEGNPLTAAAPSPQKKLPPQAQAQ